jgi:small conductance mechanosensitive channel
MKNRIIFLLALSLILAWTCPAQTEAPNPLKEKEAELRTQLEHLQAVSGETMELMSQLSKEDREIFQVEQESQAFASLDLLLALSSNLREQEKAGMEASELRTFVIEGMDMIPQAAFRAFDRNQEKVRELRKTAATAEVSELAIIEEEIGRIEALIDSVYEASLRYSTELELIGKGNPEFQDQIEKSLEFRARLISGRLKKAIERRSILKSRSSANPDDADLTLRLGAVQVNINKSVQSLEKMVRLMDPLGMNTTLYKTLLIQSTGDISRGIDTSVIWQFASNGWAAVVVWFKTQLPGLLTKIFIFIFVFLIFRLLARFVQKGVARAVGSSRVKISRLLETMIAKTSYRLVLIFGILVGLSQVGISLTPLLAGLGVAGFIIGFALQDTLGNFAAGMMILFYRPFDEGDFVEAGGVRGSVSKMSLVSTTILTIDNQTMIVPNSKIWGDVICNRTEQATRRVDLMFGVSYDSDIPKVERIIKEVIDANDKILPDPEPQIKLHELGDSSVNFVVRPWVKNADYWEVHWYMHREVKIRFDQEGVSIRFPQRDVHHYYPETGKPDAG